MGGGLVLHVLPYHLNTMFGLILFTLINKVNTGFQGLCADALGN